MRRLDPLRLALRRASEVPLPALSDSAVLSVSSQEARFDSGVGPLVSALTALCLGGHFEEYAKRLHVRPVSGGWPAVGLSSSDEVRVALSAHVLGGVHGGPVRVTDLAGVRGPLEAVGVRAQPEQHTRWLELDLDGGHELPAGVVVARLAEALGAPVEAFQVVTSSPRGELEGRYRARALLDRYVPVGELPALVAPALERAGLGTLEAGVLELFPSSGNTRLPYGWGGCTVLELDASGVEVSRARLSPGAAMGDLGQRPGVPVPRAEVSEAPCPAAPAAPVELTLRRRVASAPAARTLRARDRGPSDAVRALLAGGCGLGGSEDAARTLALDLRRRFDTLEAAEEELERLAPSIGAGSRSGARGRFADKARRALHRWWSSSDWQGGGLPLGRIPVSQVQWAVERSRHASEPSLALRVALHGLGWLAGYEGDAEGPEIAWTLWEAAAGGRRDYASLRSELGMFGVVRRELTPAEAFARERREGGAVTPYSRRWWLSEGAPVPSGGGAPEPTVDPWGDPWGTVCALVEARPLATGLEVRGWLRALGVRQVEVAELSGRSQPTVSRALGEATALPSWLLEAMNIYQGQESTHSSGLGESEGLAVVEADRRVNGRASRASDEGSPPIFPAKCPVPLVVVARVERSGFRVVGVGVGQGVFGSVVLLKGLVGARPCAQRRVPSRLGGRPSGLGVPSRALLGSFEALARASPSSCPEGRAVEQAPRSFRAPARASPA